MEDIKWKLINGFKIYDLHSGLLNSYVLDFFTKNLWSKLLPSWQSNLELLTAPEISNMLSFNLNLSGKVYPLSLYALKKTLSLVSISRQPIKNPPNENLFTDDKQFSQFWMNVKLKKRHEICSISKICYDAAVKSDCFYIVDVGAGLGHLSRILSYSYNFKVCSIEAREGLTNEALKLDSEFGKKFQSKEGYIRRVTWTIPPDATITDFLAVVRECFKIPEGQNFKFGIVGLHPCGDLGATLLKLYNTGPEIHYINIVGCCYMKLTDLGFPLSNFCSRNNYNLGYDLREVACHAIEKYVHRLEKGEEWMLKIHTYRAVLEMIILEHFPKYQHASLSNVKYEENLTLKMYCRKATKKLGIKLTDEIVCNKRYTDLLLEWKRVVVFYSLRLLFAPSIESIVLLDRVLSIKESGGNAEIVAIFDPKISPRCHVLSAYRS